MTTDKHLDAPAHTPGPWATRDGFHGEEIDVFPTYDGPPDFGEWSEVATVKDYGEDGDQTRANARLIAASPDLLAVAKKTRGLVSEAAATGFNCHDGDWAERIYANQAALTAAIRKAEGRDHG